MTFLPMLIFVSCGKLVFVFCIIYNIAVFLQSSFSFWAYLTSPKLIPLSWLIAAGSYYIGFKFTRHVGKLYALNERVKDSINCRTVRKLDSVFGDCGKGRVSSFVERIFSIIDFVIYRIGAFALAWMVLLLIWYTDRGHWSLAYAWRHWLDWGPSSRFITFKLLPLLILVNFFQMPLFLLVNRLFCCACELAGKRIKKVFSAN